MYFILIIFAAICGRGEELRGDCPLWLDTPVALTTQLWATRLRGRVVAPRESLATVGLTPGQLRRFLNSGKLLPRPNGSDLIAFLRPDHAAFLKDEFRAAGSVGVDLIRMIDAAGEDARYRSLAEALSSRHGRELLNTPSFASFLRRLLADASPAAKITFSRIRRAAEQQHFQVGTYWSGGVRALARQFGLPPESRRIVARQMESIFAQLPSVAGYTLILNPRAARRMRLHGDRNPLAARQRRLHGDRARLVGLEMSDVASIVPNGAEDARVLDQIVTHLRSKLSSLEATKD